MAKGKRINDETRAAIMAALLAGQSVNKVADEYQVGLATVSRFKQQLEKLEQKKEIPVLVMEVLHSQLETLKGITEAVRQPEYIKKQPASEVAVLYGVIADKSFKIISAMEPERTEPVSTDMGQSEHLPN